MFEVVCLISKLLNELDVDTWMSYETAPLTELQMKVSVLSQVLLPLEGEDRLGTDGGDSRVKLHVEDQLPSPQELEALTRQ